MSNDEHELDSVLKREVRSASRVRHASSVLTTVGIMAFGVMLGAHVYAWRVRVIVDPSVAGYADLGATYRTIMLVGGVVAAVALIFGVVLSTRVDGGGAA